MHLFCSEFSGVVENICSKTIINILEKHLNTFNSLTCHDRFEIWRNGSFIDPRSLVEQPNICHFA
jgi:uncharacterized Fe-S cluster-containing MiaB family protein